MKKKVEIDESMIGIAIGIIMFGLALAGVMTVCFLYQIGVLPL